MTRAFWLAAALALAAATAHAQSAGIGTGLILAQNGMDRSTGPTVPSPGITDTRQIDQNIATAPSAASPNTVETPNAENWRSSSGLNADPRNPSGAPR